MSFDSPFSDPAWVAIELYARVVDPLQLILEFPELPYVPFGQQQPRKGMPLRDVGDFRVKRQLLSILQKQVVVATLQLSVGEASKSADGFFIFPLGAKLY